MKRKSMALISLLITLLLSSIVPSLQAAYEPPPTTWSKNYPELQGSGHRVIQTSDGGYAVGGFSNNSFLLLKTTSNGNIQWWKTYGIGQAYSVVQTSDGGYALAGYGFSNLVKTDSAGRTEWTKEYKKDTLSYVVKSLVQTSDGGYAMAGWNYATTMGSVAGDWVIKTDASGNVQWNRTYGTTPGQSMATGILETSDGELILAANRLIYKLNKNGDIQWSHDCVISNALAKTKDGGYVLVAGTGAVLVKTDSEGVTQWSKSFAAGGWNFFDSVMQTRDGGYIISGVMFSDVGLAWIIKTDSAGNEEWSTTYQPVPSSNNKANSIIEADDGGFVFCGEKGVRGGWQTGDVWLVKIGGNASNEQPPDTTTPIVSIILPENKTYNATSVSLSFTVNEVGTSISYSVDCQANLTLNGNTTLTDLPYGIHNITVYATDSAGNTGASETITFTIAMESEAEPFPTTLVIASIVAVAVISVCLFVYFKKSHRNKSP